MFEEGHFLAYEFSKAKTHLQLLLSIGLGDCTPLKGDEGSSISFREKVKYLGKIMLRYVSVICKCQSQVE